MIATQLRILLTPAPNGMTSTHIHYLYTALSPAGNTELDRNFTPECFRSKMQGWEVAINHFLRHGTIIPVAARE
jgi:hypothetical protein